MPPRAARGGGGSGSAGAAKRSSNAKKQRASAQGGRVGLLGVRVPDSSDDDDYAPPAAGPRAAQPRGARRGGGRGSGDGGAAAASSKRGGKRGRSGGKTDGIDGNDDSDTPLKARQARVVGRAVAAAAAATGARYAGALPANALALIFAAACRPRGALPTACRLARVCRAWRDALNAAPEVWATMDARGRRSAEADEWLQTQAAAGRFRALEQLTVGAAASTGGGGGGGGSDDDDDDAGGGGGGRRQREEAAGPPDGGTSSAALMALVTNAPNLRVLTLYGRTSIAPGALAAAAAAAPRLEKLLLVDANLSAHAGLDRAAADALAAAWGGARPLQAFSALHCPLIGTRVLRMLCHGPLPAAAGAAAAAEGPPQPQQQEQDQAAANGDAAAAAAAPPQPPQPQPQPQPPPPPVVGLPFLKVLDLSGSCVLPGLLVPVEALQAAAPALETLSLEGVGAIYGWTPTRRPANAPRGPSWPQLRTLLLGAMPTHTQTTLGLAATRSSGVDDALLLRLAGGSPLLTDLSLRGTQVTPAGLRAVAEAACSGSGSGEVALPLERLAVTSSPLCSDAGLEAIASLAARTLRVLWAARAGAAVSDEGLSALEACEALEDLDVSGSSVTDLGLKKLLASPHAGAALRTLSVESCRSLGRQARQAAANGGITALRAKLEDDA